jgi:hypothetical protein
LSPPYTAVNERLPVGKVEVVRVAVPLTNVPLPIVAAPSLNATVPVALAGFTVAVSVTV